MHAMRPNSWCAATTKLFVAMLLVKQRPAGASYSMQTVRRLPVSAGSASE